jgi:predicted small lipoprotein YifL
VGRTLVFAAAAALVLTLSACGRKGPLDLPPSDTPTPNANNGSNLTQPALAPSSFLPGNSPNSAQANAQNPPVQRDAQGNILRDAQGNPLPLGPKKTFILDPIIQ